MSLSSGPSAGIILSIWLNTLPLLDLTCFCPQAHGSIRRKETCLGFLRGEMIPSVCAASTWNSPCAPLVEKNPTIVHFLMKPEKFKSKWLSYVQLCLGNVHTAPAKWTYMVMPSWYSITMRLITKFNHISRFFCVHIFLDFFLFVLVFPMAWSVCSLRSSYDDSLLFKFQL